MHEKIFLFLMVILATVTLNTPKLRRAVIFLGLFSLVASFAYLMHGAPDVAIAEAIIGSGISTVLYLVAIKRYQVFTIYHIQSSDIEKMDATVKKETTRLKKSIESLLIEKELEPQTVFTMETPSDILVGREYDLLIRQNNENVTICGFSQDYHLDDIERTLAASQYEYLHITIVRCEEGVIPNAQVD